MTPGFLPVLRRRQQINVFGNFFFAPQAANYRHLGEERRGLQIVNQFFRLLISGAVAKQLLCFLKLAIAAVFSLLSWGRNPLVVRAFSARRQFPVVRCF